MPGMMNMSNKALIGLDGFVDEVLYAVDQRFSSEKFSRLRTIREYGTRILEGCGLSTNIELVPIMRKLGGNGPIYAEGLNKLGVEITYLGCVGKERIHPVFHELEKRTHMIGIADPGYTEAIEFSDGKIIQSKTSSLNCLRWEDILDKIEIRELIRYFQESSLISFNNWTMIFHMNEIWEHILQEVAPYVTEKSSKLIFFDLADPRKRTDEDVCCAISLIRQFKEAGFSVQLGMNLKEAVSIANLLYQENWDPGELVLEKLIRKLESAIKIDTIVVHPTDRAGCISNGIYEEVKGPYCSNPKFTTGAGDIFNSGFVYGQLQGKTYRESLLLGTAASGYYVRNGHSASTEELNEFINQWMMGKIN